MADKRILKEWVLESLRQREGSARLVDVAKDIWSGHQTELRGMGDLFYTWQYDMRWAATSLRQAGKLKPNAPGEPWRLA